MSDLKKFDPWLLDNGPAALVIREYLTPVDGPDGVLFPATFAPSEDKKSFPGGYNINTFPDGKNVCLIDSVGSQANRLEPMFEEAKYAALVPQIVVKAGDRLINLFEAGHRAADAIVRCSALQDELHDAFKAVLNGNAEPLAKIAPTSLVFGVWDSRGTQAKLPRLVASTIRAFDVRKLTRSAQYVPATEYVATGVLDDPDQMEDQKEKNRLSDAYAQRGFIHVPASGSPGGVMATGGIRRDATLSLAALRLLAVRDAEGAHLPDRTIALRRYILGLALTAFTATPDSYLRQGCNLVPDVNKPREFKLVHSDGTQEEAKVTHAEALAYATAAAKDFRIGDSRTVEFDKQRAATDINGESPEGDGAPVKTGKVKGGKSKKK
jgi:CRISPR-associated protein Csb1